MWHKRKGKLLESRHLDKYHVLWTVQAPDIAKDVKPGQFVHVAATDARDPLLRRPISIFACDKQSGTLGLLFRVVGQGTRWMADARVGAPVDMIGPLGNGWPENVTGRPVLVAGGIGVAPMVYLSQEYVRSGKQVTFLLGARTSGELFGTSEIKNAGAALSIATDDGSHGHEGFVTELLLNERKRDTSEKTILACGPGPMLRAVQRIAAEKSVPCFVSLEQRMACGIGACLGCIVKLAPPATGYKKVCSDGPVFDSRMVVIEDV
jgi:dihydroorotate dehydrogenase electron transfer subunit